MNPLNPTNYKLRIEPNLKDFTFSGTADIRLIAPQPITGITLNALDLTIQTCSIQTNGADETCPFRLIPENEVLEISLPKEVSGTIQLKIEYTGEINNRMAGFYRSAYGSEEDRQYIAVTQFQESDARRAFPCLDHPGKKATFDIEMVVDESIAVISNTAVQEQEPLGNGKARIRFRQTPKMSTYLVFFGVGDFLIRENEKDARVRIVTLPGQEGYTQFGLDFGGKALKFCEDYFAIPYPLPKLDLIGVPDFAFGAMENWGAITFRENLLLHYPEITSKAGEERICEVIAHEIVHQWFGNLVTPSDWKYLWLNESFATYFGFGVVDHYYPEWDMWRRFLSSTTDTALERDALKETYSVEIPSGDHVVINASTAPIIYNKGGSILRQIEGYIGTDLFREGLRNYLGKHAYGCAASHHLWETFEAASKKPITRMVKSWIEQPGFPLIEAGREGADLILTQKQFTYLQNESDQTWLVPILIQVLYDSGDSQIIKTLLEDKTVRVPIGEKAVAYKINYGQTGFFRTKYADRKNLDSLGKRILKKEIPPEDRWGIENDLFALVKRGDVSLNEYLDFLANYQNENAFLPLISIADHLFDAFLILDENGRQRIASSGKPFIEQILQDIGQEPAEEEPATLSILRDRIIWHAVIYGSKEVEVFSVSKFRLLLEGKGIHPDIRKSVMKAGALIEDHTALEWLEKSFRSSDSEHERMNILAAIGCVKQKKTLERALRFTLETVPDRNKFVPIVSAAANPFATPYLWDWYLSHLEELEKLHPLLYERVISAVLPVCGVENPDAVKIFFQAYLKKDHAPKDVINMSLERLDINLRFRNAA